MKKLTTEEFIERSNIKHNYKYNYSLTNYINISTKVTIICPVHGKFEQSPDSHLNRGSGCRKCRYDSLKKDKEFIARANVVHNNKYDYSLVNYVNSTSNITIVCPIHGEFQQTPASHINQKSGCFKCGRVKSKQTVLKELSKKHNHKYYYPDLDEHPEGNDTISIICPKHGIFNQRLSSHLEGYGCPKCNIDNKSTSFDIFVQKANKAHLNKFEYVKSSYSNLSSDVLVICPKHGEFITNASNHTRGSDCPSCAQYGFDPNKPAILYYLSINNGQAYKIGITNRSIKERFESDMKYIKVIHQIQYRIGREAYEEEQRILKQFKKYQYRGQNLLKNGNTELFNTDILNLKDKHEQRTGT